MIQRYINPKTHEVAVILEDKTGYRVKSKYGTRTKIYEPHEIRGDPTVFFELILEHGGFLREGMWLCITDTCPRVKAGWPCSFSCEKDPTGECLKYPKRTNPELSHGIVRYIRVRGTL